MTEDPTNREMPPLKGVDTPKKCATEAETTDYTASNLSIAIALANLINDEMASIVADIRQKQTRITALVKEQSYLAALYPGIFPPVKAPTAPGAQKGDDGRKTDGQQQDSGLQGVPSEGVSPIRPPLDKGGE